VVDPELVLMCLLGASFDVFSFLFFLVGLHKLSLNSGVRLSFLLHAKCIVADAKLTWHEEFKCVKE
jgi:hypothetical protein